MGQIPDLTTLKNILKVRYIVIFIFTLSYSFSVAQTTAFTFGSATSTSILFNNQTLGLKFTVNSTIQVTSLGIYDRDVNGLGISHIARLYNSDGTVIIATVVIPSGTGGTLIGGFRYAELMNPVTLVPGDYTVAVYYPGPAMNNDLAEGFATITSGSEISNVSAFFTSGNIFPSISFFAGLATGPNFQYRLPAAAVPTLSQWGILIFGLSLLAMGLVVVYNVQSSRKVVISGYGSTESHTRLNLGRFNIPFDVEKYKLNLVWSVGLAVIGFAAIYMIWGKIISDDIIGMSIMVPLVAYVLYLMKEE